MNDLSQEERMSYAQQMQGNPLFKEIMSKLRSDLEREMLKADLVDRDRHQALLCSYQWLATIEAHIEHALTEAKVTQFNLEQMRKVI